VLRRPRRADLDVIGDALFVGRSTHRAGSRVLSFGSVPL
jgi:hypothetical protein